MAQTDAIKPIRALARPKVLAIGCIAVFVAAGWIYLALTLAGMSGVTALEVLCRPMFGSSGFGAEQALLLFVMWCAMALAMMLPTAAPMILTYADLADTAAAKGEPAASPLILTAGYILVWLGTAPVVAALPVRPAGPGLLGFLAGAGG